MAIQNLKILGIDTSCDDTCIALLEIKNSKLEILSNIVSSQVKLHAKYGGVYPSLAIREHKKNLPLVFKKVLQQTQNKPFDLIGVTVGPGLEPCLWQGINFAKDLAKKFKKPLISVNHIEAHILANFIDRGLTSISFPAICLVVSGGHTGLILMNEIGKYQLIGETRDDAAGECFDKVARILGLDYPGGPAIAAKAIQIEGSRTPIILPRPMINQRNYDFSFSGLKTAVLYKVKGRKVNIPEVCREIQQAIIDVLIKKTIKAAKDYRVKSIILGGGVVANIELRKQIKEKIKKDFQLYIPDSKFCTDNGVMIAITAYFHRAKKTKEIKADANLKI